MAPPQPAPPPETPIFRTPDELLQDIFLRVPTAVDLARASAACPSFRRLITDHTFLRSYRALHPPPLIGAFDDNDFIPGQPPHPSAFAARAFAGFDFSCSSFLPSTAGRTWRAIDFLDGRALLAGAPVQEESGVLGVRHFRYHNFLVRDLAVCDPVHRRYILLPAAPGHLKALVHETDLLDLETFLAPGEDEKDPLSYRVVCLAQCRMNLLLLVFSSLDGQWHVLTCDQWSASATLASFANSEPGLSNRQFVHGCFYWHLHFRNELLVLDVHAMQFSAVRLPPERPRSNSFVIVEAAEGMLGILTKGCDGGEEDPYWLAYSILRNNQWVLERVTPLPVTVKYANLVGVAGGYLLIEALYTTSPQEKPRFGYFSVDVKTLQVELFATLSKIIFPGRLYASFPPSLCAPTI